MSNDIKEVIDAFAVDILRNSEFVGIIRSWALDAVKAFTNYRFGGTLIKRYLSSEVVRIFSNHSGFIMWVTYKKRAATSGDFLYLQDACEWQRKENIVYVPIEAKIIMPYLLVAELMKQPIAKGAKILDERSTYPATEKLDDEVYKQLNNDGYVRLRDAWLTVPGTNRTDDPAFKLCQKQAKAMMPKGSLAMHVLGISRLG